MKIKGKGIVRTEQITCRVLFLVSIIAFALCFVMEYFFPLWIDEYYCELLHLEFLKNVMLGVSGSSFISFICIIFPYLKKRGDFIYKVQSQMKPIFLCYLDLYNELVSVNTKGIFLKKEDVDTYSFEIKLYETSQKLLKKIDSFVISYKDYGLSSRDVDNLIIFLNREVSKNINVIKLVVSFIVPEEYSNNPLEIPKDLKKDNFLNLSEKEICGLILNEMNKIFNVKKFKKNFMKIQLEENRLRVLDEALSRLSQTLKSCEESLMMWEKNDNDRILLSIKYNIDRIKRYHKKQYKEELKYTFFNTIKTIGYCNDKIIDKFQKALEEDRLADAKKIIDDLKQL